jgi:hypothetical protein
MENCEGREKALRDFSQSFPHWHLRDSMGEKASSRTPNWSFGSLLGGFSKLFGKSLFSSQFFHTPALSSQTDLWRKSCGCWGYLQLAVMAKIGKETTNLQSPPKKVVHICAHSGIPIKYSTPPTQNYGRCGSRVNTHGQSVISNYECCLALRSVLSTSWIWPK